MNIKMRKRLPVKPILRIERPEGNDIIFGDVCCYSKGAHIGTFEMVVPQEDEFLIRRVGNKFPKKNIDLIKIKVKIRWKRD